MLATLGIAKGSARTQSTPARSTHHGKYMLHPLTHRIGWCLRSLAGLASAAARGEDRYGVVLLCDPGLADILAALLSAVAALQQYTKFVVGGNACDGAAGAG